MYLPTILLPTDDIAPHSLGELIGFSTLTHNQDLLTIQPLEGKVSISIDQVHSMQQGLAYRPLHENRKVVLILKAHALTVPAQQALLKTLEEPPHDTQIILVTSFPQKLLPTILSRVTILASFSSQTEVGPSQEPMYTKLKASQISDCIHMSDEWGKTREGALEIAQRLLTEVHTLTHKNASASLLNDERAIMVCIEQLEKNAHVKLALDHLFFTITGNI